MSQSQPRLVLVNAWHDDNKGDSGICEAILSLLRKRWPDAKLGLVSIISERSEAFKTAYRHLEKSFPDLEITPSPFVFYDPVSSGNRYQGMANKLPLVMLRLLPFLAKSHPALKLIAEADLVVANGGHYLFTGNNSIRSTGRLLRMFYPVLAAQSYKIPYIFFSQSFGPFNDPFSDRFAQFLLRGAKAVLPREKISAKNLIELGVPESKIRVIPDSAFALEPQMSVRVKNILSKYDLKEGKFWVITVRQSTKGSQEEKDVNTKKFLDQVAVMVSGALQSGIVKQVALVVHTQGPTELENDRLPTLALAERLKHEFAVKFIDEDLSPRELSALYGCASFMVGTRFHSVIFALIAGTPAYAISYGGPKTWGIMEMLGMKELCSDLETFSSDEAFARISTVDLTSQVAKIRDRTSKLREELEAAVFKLEIPS